MAEKKFATFREEMDKFRLDLKEYYAFFTAQSDQIAKLIQDNQMINDREVKKIRQDINMVSNCSRD